MAEKALFLGGRLVNRSIVTSQTAVGGLPVTNLQNYMPEKKFRATGTSEMIYLQLPVATACNAVALIGHNLTNLASVAVFGATSLTALVNQTPEYNSGWMEVWPGGVKPNEEEWPQWSTLARFPNGNSWPWYSVWIYDPSNPSPIELGRLMLDKAFRPTFTIGHNYGVGLILADAQRRTPFNRIYAERRGPPGRSMALPLTMITKRDLWDNLYTMSRLYGMHEDFFICIDPSETVDLHKIMMQAMFADANNFESQPIFDGSGNIWRTSLSLVELV